MSLIDDKYGFTPEELAAVENAHKAPVRPAGERNRIFTPQQTTQLGRKKLDVALKKIAASQDNKHTELLKAAKLVGGAIAGGLLDEAEGTEALESAIESKPGVKSLKTALNTIRDGINYGKSAPLTIEKEEGEREAYRQANPAPNYEQENAKKEDNPTLEVGNPLDTPFLSSIVPATNSAPTNLEKVLATREILRKAKARQITFSSPIISQDGRAVIFPNTVNVIQGQAGVHKSRLAETICSSLLKRPSCSHDLLGFSANLFKSYQVVYVDTERNLKEQLPYALQQIQLKAGYEISDEPYNFDFISLLDIARKERFSTLSAFLNHVRQTVTNHIFIVLDVTTDCIRDFNKSEDSMELIDLMNEAINHFDVTFLCLIHENPGAQKARGHVGTEIMNKASTVIQVGFEKDSSQNDTNIIRVKYLKCRSTERHTPFYIRFCPLEKGLVLADASEVAGVINSRKHKANEEDMIEYLELWLTEPMTRKELIEKIMTEFHTSDKTADERIKSIIEQEMEMHNSKGELCLLHKGKVGKDVIYSLSPVNASE